MIISRMSVMTRLFLLCHVVCMLLVHNAMCSTTLLTTTAAAKTPPHQYLRNHNKIIKQKNKHHYHHHHRQLLVIFNEEKEDVFLQEGEEDQEEDEIIENSEDDQTFSYKWDRNHVSNTSSSNGHSVLIVQDASPGLDEVVLSLTSKVNRAYAQRWKFDYLQFTGIAVAGVGTGSSSSNDGNNGNDTSNENGTFNKPYLLQKLIQAKIENNNPNHNVAACGQSTIQQTDSQDDNNDSTGSSDSNSNSNSNSDNQNTTTDTITTTTKCKEKPYIGNYDYVLFLDSSAIIVQLDYNILNLIQSNKMIATSMSNMNGIVDDIVITTNGVRNNNNNDENNNINNNVDVMIWNLNHPQTNYFSNLWMEQCYQQFTTTTFTTTAAAATTTTTTSSSPFGMIQSEIILAKILMNETTMGKSNINNNSSGNSNDNDPPNNYENEIIINPIPKEMVDGLQGTLIKQDMSYNYYMIDDQGLRQVMPLLSGISDSVCYRFYPQCEVV